MYRALMFAVGLFLVSEVHAASDAYIIAFPQLEETPIFTGTCEGLDLPCSPNKTSFAYDFQPFKLAFSFLRIPAPPKRNENVFRFVELPYIDHGEEDYDRLQSMIGQTGPSAERLWVHGYLGLSKANFEKHFRLVRAILPSKKASDAVALCVFTAQNLNLSVPYSCTLLAFRSENRKFLLSSIGFSAGFEDLKDWQYYYPPEFFSREFREDDPKAKILKSRHKLERTFERLIGSVHLSNGLVAVNKIDNSEDEASNGSKIEYLFKREILYPENQKLYFSQTISFHFHLQAGGEWRAYYVDGTEDSGIELQGDTRDWSVALDWEIQTAVHKSTGDLDETDLNSLRDPEAIGADIVDGVRTRFLRVMREICKPAKSAGAGDDESPIKGYLIVECRSD